MKNKHLKQLNIDTTVQEKAIAYPTDSRLAYEAREKLVVMAHKRELKLRQTYIRVDKKLLLMQGRYAHARQLKRANKARKQLKTHLGRVIRDIKRKLPDPDPELGAMLDKAEKIYYQQKNDKNKLYSLWAPEVVCIAKGKAHKKYEYGCKVSIATTCMEPWVVASYALENNPYDGHTLNFTVSKAEENTGVKPENIFVDRGYKGKQHEPLGINVYRSGRRGLKGQLKKLLRARSAIEPIIGHMKQQHGLGRNQLHKIMGDKINALLSGCGFNLRKILNLIKNETTLRLKTAVAI